MELNSKFVCHLGYLANTAPQCPCAFSVEKVKRIPLVGAVLTWNHQVFVIIPKHRCVRSNVSVCIASLTLFPFIEFCVIRVPLGQ